MAEVLLVNPRKRRRAASKRKSPSIARRPKSTLARRVRRARPAPARKRRRNPAARRGVMGMVKTTAASSAVAAGGALALDVAWGVLPIPEQLKSGPIRHLAKGAGAIGIGMLAAMFTKQATANLIATGAMTVVMHTAGKEMLGRFVPQINLGEYDDELGYASAGWTDDGMGAYVDGMGAYVEGVEDFDPGMGEYVEGFGEYDEEEIDI